MTRSTSTPSLIIFDVNETLSDMSPIADRFVDIGAPAHLARSWFAALLRDGFALTNTGSNPRFSDLIAESLRMELYGTTLGRSLDEAVGYITDGFGSLSVHPDVVEGIDELSALGFRLATLSNGSADIARGLLDSAGIAQHFEGLLSVDDAGIWKPAAASYEYALQTCEVDPYEAMLVAVHPWDIDGASKVGLTTAWINRGNDYYPDYFAEPDRVAVSLVDLAAKLR